MFLISVSYKTCVVNLLKAISDSLIYCPKGKVAGSKRDIFDKEPILFIDSHKLQKQSDFEQNFSGIS